MTGIDALREKLTEMGANKAQLDSKVIPMMLAIFADESNAIDAYKAFEETWIEARKAAQEAMTIQDRSRKWEERLEERQNAIKRMLDDLTRKAEKIATCETPEGRDRMRLALWFKDNAYTDNVYQRTEYNKGLAAILAGGGDDGQTTE